MTSRTVRLDDEAEQALDEIRRRTGMTISQALKRGLLALSRQVADEREKTSWAVYERLDNNKTQAAKALEIGLQTLHRRLKAYGVK